jgi:hypothetical protein
VFVAMWDVAAGQELNSGTTQETEAAINAALAALDLSAYQRRRVRAAAVDLAEKPPGDTIETITLLNKLRTLCRKLRVPFAGIETAAMPTTTPPPRRNLIIPPSGSGPVEGEGTAAGG